MSIFNLSFILFAVLASKAYTARMSIFSPNDLALKFPNGIEFSTAHFGNVPYSAYLAGNLVLANSIYACDPLEDFSGGDEWTIQKNIVAITRRGGCRIPNKSRNAQRAGAKILLIVNDRDGPVSEWFGHEHGDDIHIPTLMIEQDVGEKLIRYLQLEEFQPDFANPTAIFNFPTEFKKAKPRLDFWYSAADISGVSYSFIKHIRQVVKENNLRFVPHWVSWTSGNAHRHGFMIEDPDCLSGGLYCAPDPDDKGPLTGGDVVYENLRQACVYCYNSEIWWDYTQEYARTCLHVDNLRKCAEETMERVASSEDIAIIEWCIEDSWNIPIGQQNYNEKIVKNRLLAKEQEHQTEYNIHSFPTLFINFKLYSGDLNNLYKIFKEVCRGMEPLNQQCKSILGIQEYVEVPIGSNRGKIILVLSIILLAALVTFYFCRRMMRRESTDIPMQVEEMVSRYFALNEIQQKKKKVVYMYV